MYLEYRHFDDNVHRNMTTPSSDSVPGDPRVDLAYLRTEWALERTQLSWVRTSFAVITAGLALDKGTEALHEARLLKGINWVEGGHAGGILLTAFASVFLMIATVQYQQRLRQLALGQSQRPSFFSPAMIVSCLVFLLGLIVSMLLLLWG